jgi:AI-2 transport protein TqsA
MNDRKRPSALARFLIGGACLVIVIAGMRAASDLINAFVLATVITLSVSPFLHWLIEKGTPEKLAAVFLIILVLALATALLFIVFLSTNRLVDRLPSYETQVGEMRIQLDEWFLERGIDLSEILAIDNLASERLVGVAVKVMLSASDAVAGWALMILLVAFMLSEAANIPRKILDALNSDTDTLARVSRLNTEIRQYVIIMTWSGSLMAVADAILLIVVGIPFALLWAVLSFFMAYIPVLGFVIALIPPTLLALLQYGWKEALVVIIGYSVIKGLVFSVLRPVFAGKKLNLSRLAFTVSVVFWVWVLGPIGALVALPLTMAAKNLLLESSEEGRVLAAVMSAGSSPRAASGTESTLDQVA